MIYKPGDKVRSEQPDEETVIPGTLEPAYLVGIVTEILDEQTVIVGWDGWLENFPDQPWENCPYTRDTRHWYSEIMDIDEIEHWPPIIDNDPLLYDGPLL